MVFYKDSFVLCHDLTKKGESAYHEFLERKADEIMFRHEHPFRWFWGKIAGFFGQSS